MPISVLNSHLMNRFMLRKLYSTVSGACCADNPDSPQHQEVLLPGSLYGMIIKERMEEILNNIRYNINTDVRNGVTVDFNDSQLYSYCEVASNVSFLYTQSDTLAKLSLKLTLTLEQSWSISLPLAISSRPLVLISNKLLGSLLSPKS